MIYDWISACTVCMHTSFCLLSLSTHRHKTLRQLYTVSRAKNYYTRHKLNWKLRSQTTFNLCAALLYIVKNGWALKNELIWLERSHLACFFKRKDHSLVRFFSTRQNYLLENYLVICFPCYANNRTDNFQGQELKDYSKPSKKASIM